MEQLNGRIDSWQVRRSEVRRHETHWHLLKAFRAFLWHSFWSRWTTQEIRWWRRKCRHWMRRLWSFERKTAAQHISGAPCCRSTWTRWCKCDREWSTPSTKLWFHECSWLCRYQLLGRKSRWSLLWVRRRVKVLRASLNGAQLANHLKASKLDELTQLFIFNHHWFQRKILIRVVVVQSRWHSDTNTAWLFIIYCSGEIVSCAIQSRRIRVRLFRVFLCLQPFLQNDVIGCAPCDKNTDDWRDDAVTSLLIYLEHSISINSNDCDLQHGDECGILPYWKPIRIWNSHVSYFDGQWFEVAWSRCRNHENIVFVTWGRQANTDVNCARLKFNLNSQHCCDDVNSGE